jgi:UDP-glucose 4-epimerase
MHVGVEVTKLNKLSQKMERIAILGGAGFIGHELVAALLCAKEDADVVVIGRKKCPQTLINQKVQYFQGDVSNALFLRNALKDVTMAVDLTCATTPSVSYANPLTEINDNLRTAVSIMECAAQLGLKKYLLVSSGGTVYGDSSAKVISEDHPTNPKSPYGIAKLTIEKFANFFYVNADLPVVIARPANPYGVKQLTATTQGFIGKCVGDVFIRKIPVKLYGKHGTTRDYIHVKDVATGLLRCLFSGDVGQVFNIGTGSGTSNAAVLDLIQKLRPKTKFSVERLAPRNFDVSYNVLSPAKLTEQTGWTAMVSLQDGILELIEQAERHCG